MTEVKLCRNCKYSMHEPDREWYLRCVNPIVNSRDPWALSSGKTYGSSAQEERSKKWSGKCGIKGKLWEKKDVT